MAARPYSAREERIGNVVVKWMSQINTWVYRATGGKVGARFIGGAPVFLLITKGRRSGQPRVSPLLYLEDGDNYVIVASKGGMAHHPLWYHNLVAHPDCEIEIGPRRLPMHARQASDAEKAALWPRLVAMYSSYADYQERTSRNIPVLILHPRA